MHPAASVRDDRTHAAHTSTSGLRVTCSDLLVDGPTNIVPKQQLSPGLLLDAQLTEGVINVVLSP